MIKWLQKRLIESAITQEEIKLRGQQRFEQDHAERKRDFEAQRLEQLEQIRDEATPLIPLSILDIPIGLLGSLSNKVNRMHSYVSLDGFEIVYNRDFDDELTIRQILEVVDDT